MPPPESYLKQKYHGAFDEPLHEFAGLNIVE